MTNTKALRKELLVTRANAEAVISSVDKQLAILAEAEKTTAKTEKKPSKNYLKGAALAKARINKQFPIISKAS